MENSSFTEPLNLEFYFSLFIFPLKVREMLWSYRKMLKNWTSEDIGVSYEQNFACTDNPGQNIRKK